MMTEEPRTYTLAEIDRMRSALYELWQRRNPWGNVSNEKMALEDRLRTYLVAGITPEALEATADREPVPENAGGKVDDRSNWRTWWT